jgi:hypothetical protein
MLRRSSKAPRAEAVRSVGAPSEVSLQDSFAHGPPNLRARRALLAAADVHPSPPDLAGTVCPHLGMVKGIGLCGGFYRRGCSPLAHAVRTLSLIW